MWPTVRVSLAVAVVLWHCLGVEATIIAKTSMNECNNYGGTDLQNRLGKPCSTKLVIALTVQANEVGVCMGEPIPVN